MCPDSSNQGKKESGEKRAQGEESTKCIFLAKSQLLNVSLHIFQQVSLQDKAYLRNKGRNQESAAENQSHYRRGNKRLGSLHVKVLRPHRYPPWVGEMLLVENLEGVRRSTQDSDAEDNDDAGDDGLGQVERSGVDLHLDKLISLKFDLVVLSVSEKRSKEQQQGITTVSFGRCQPGAPVCLF